MSIRAKGVITVKTWNGATRQAESAPEAVRLAIEMWEMAPTAPGKPGASFYVAGQHVRTVNNLPLLKRQLELWEKQRKVINKEDD